MTRPLPLLHIGFHKTASTLLQDMLFSDAKLGFCMLEDDRKAIHNAFILRGALENQPDPAIVGNLRREEKCAADKGLNLVISHERLSGYPASGGFDQGIIAERLHAAFPEAKVLMLIREQKSMIYSMYLQTISDGGTLSLRRFLEPPEPGLLRKPGFRFDFYNYDRLIQKYHSLFGAENVLVLPFERLRSQSEGTVRQIIEHCRGADQEPMQTLDHFSNSVNKGRPLAFQALRRRMNLFLRNQLSENGLITVPVNYVEKGVRKVVPAAEILRPFDSILKPRMHRVIAEACAGRFEHSNRETERLTGLDLGSLGYSLDTPDESASAASGLEDVRNDSD